MNAELKTHKDLDAWKRSLDLLGDVQLVVKPDVHMTSIDHVSDPTARLPVLNEPAALDYGLVTHYPSLITVFWLMTDDYRLLTDSLLPITHHCSPFAMAFGFGFGCPAL